MKVKKEVTVAVIIGLVLGLVVIGGVLRARTALLQLPQTVSELRTNPEKTSETPDNSLFLTLETKDNQVLKTPSLTLSGKTLPGTYIVINGEAGDSIIVPDGLGTFSQEINLVKGANIITVSVYQEDGTKEESTLTAIYTTAEI